MYEVEITIEELFKKTEKLDVDFYVQDATKAAREMLGCIFVIGNMAGIIVETEAYLEKNDLAAHSSKGITGRTQFMFGPPGRSYVYLVYGIYDCLNIITEPEGNAGCVLIRALQPLCGIEEMQKNRNIYNEKIKDLANGPGKLTKALNITRKYNNVALDQDNFCIRKFKNPENFEILATPRIGITKSADLPLRFIWKDNPFLSRKN